MINQLNYNVFLLIFLNFGLSSSVFAQRDIDLNQNLATFNADEYPNKDITDGPYIFYENDEIIIKWIEKNKIVQNKITESNFNLIKDNFGFDLKLEWLKKDINHIDYKQEYKNINKIISLSDIHGQYKLFVKILREYDVIDENNNWSFGNGHLVIVGDIFDRGSQVNEALWMVFKLEHQARAKGGGLHYTIGNHEEMVINKDLRYVNKKYLESAEKMNLTYDMLFAENTLMGNWLRRKPVILQLNDILFVHGGISPEIVEKDFSAEQINKEFINNIIGFTKAETAQDSTLTFLRGSKGPIWYRGYFKDENLGKEDIDKILQHFNKKHIVVGHTSQKSIISLFNNRIFGVDSSIKNGKYGEILFYQNGEFYRGPIKLMSKY